METVAAVPRHAHFDGNWPQGFLAATPSVLARLERSASFRPRAAAEEDPEWKQLIPYCVVQRGDTVLCLERLSAQSEHRLHRRLSIGVGGHVNPVDAPLEGAVARGLLRELHEELRLPRDCGEPRFLGLINDDSNAVGRVHVGLAFVLRLAAGSKISVRETRKMVGRFSPLADLRSPASAGVAESSKLWQHHRRFESWSTIALEAWPWTVSRTLPPGHRQGPPEANSERT